MLGRIVANNSIWKKNIAALKERDYPLACRLLEAPLLLDRYFVAPASDYTSILTIQMPDGAYFPLDEPQDSLKKRQEWIQAIGATFLHNAHVMLIGFCSGHHISLLHRLADGNTYIWIVEPDLSLLKAAFHVSDFSSVILSPRILFAVGLSPEHAAKKLFTGVTSNRMRAQGIRMTYPPAAGRLYADYIRKMAISIEQATRGEELKLRTVETQGLYILKNLAANLPRVLESAPVSNLWSSAAGVPALVVAPGPSLRDALPLIAAHRDAAILIAIDTALPILVKHGISPDLIVSLDFTELNARHFDGVDAGIGILAASPVIDPQITRRYAGRTYFFSHHAARLIHKLPSLTCLGELKAHSSTAHAAYHLARRMGCAPIVLIGNDLSFPGLRRYAPGAMQDALEHPTIAEDALFAVAANDGGTVKTDALYHMFLEAFADLIQETAGIVINTSQHGARIPGVVFMQLEDVFMTPNRQKVDTAFLARSLFPPLHRYRRLAIEDLSQLIAACRTSEKDLQKLIHGIRTTSGMEPDFEKKIRHTYDAFFSLHENNQSVFYICTFLCPRATISLFGDTDRTFFPGGNTDPENKEAKNRCLRYLNDYRNAMRLNAEVLDQACEILQRDLHCSPMDRNRIHP
jgi:hypothetical protein